MLFHSDEDYMRPVGLGAPTGRSPFGFRQMATLGLVLVLGGGLGTGAYFLSHVDARDIIGLLDVADPQRPRLAIPLPGRSGGRGSAELLTPPHAGGEDPGIIDDSPPEIAPLLPPAAAAPKVAAPVADPVAIRLPPPAAETAAVVPPLPAAPLTASPSTATIKAVAAKIPALPTPRGADQPPTYAAMPARADAKGLVVGPLKELLRDSPHGMLPVVAADGRQPWRVYARPFDGTNAAPRVAVVITDLGLDRAATEAAITRLPPDVSLAFSPYATDVAAWIKKARAAGHEALVMLPVEPPDYPARDPGPLGLLVAATQDDNIARLETLLARSPATIGVAARPGSHMIGSPQMNPVLATLLQRGLLYVGEGARGNRIPPATTITMVIDQDPWRDAIDARLAAALDAAKGQGGAVLLASAKPVTLDRLALWLADLPGKGFAPAPVSALVKAPGKP